MKIFAAKNLSVELNQIHEKGTPWEVSVHKNVMGFKRRISSDWFLGEEQARKFAEQLCRDLQSGIPTTALKQRKPGWTLHRSAH